MAKDIALRDYVYKKEKCSARDLAEMHGVTDVIDAMNRLDTDPDYLKNHLPYDLPSVPELRALSLVHSDQESSCEDAD